MTRNEINNLYFEWMYSLVFNAKYFKRLSYRKLLIYLNDVDFYYDIPMDANREDDGIELRYRFGYEKGYEQRDIALYLDNRPCSVLEMMIALSVRCEEHIMSDPDMGNRTGQWFWNMLVNLGLEDMNDDEFDEDYVETVIGKFLNREYEQNGKGGLFIVNDTEKDLRKAEIWYQLCWYLNENM